MKFNPFQWIWLSYLELSQGTCPFWKIIGYHFILFPLLSFLPQIIFEAVIEPSTPRFHPIRDSLWYTSDPLCLLPLLHFFVVTVLAAKASSSWRYRPMVICLGLIFTLAIYLPNTVAVKEFSCGTIKKYSRVGLETAEQVAGALLAYRKVTSVNEKTSLKDLEPYLNFVEIGHEGKYVSVSGEEHLDCASPNWRCIHMHNGALVAFNPSETFGGTDDKHAIRFLVQPRGYPIDESQTEDRKFYLDAAAFYLYPSTRVKTDRDLNPNTQSNIAHYYPNPDKIPDWMFWHYEHYFTRMAGRDYGK